MGPSQPPLPLVDDKSSRQLCRPSFTMANRLGLPIHKWGLAILSDQDILPPAIKVIFPRAGPSQDCCHMRFLLTTAAYPALLLFNIFHNSFTPYISPPSKENTQFLSTHQRRRPCITCTDIPRGCSRRSGLSFYYRL